MIPKEYYGRLFTKEQLPVDYLSEAVKLESMIKVDKKNLDVKDVIVE